MIHMKCQVLVSLENYQMSAVTITNTQWRAVNNIDMKVLISKVDNISREWENEVINALLDYIRCTKQLD